MDANTYASISFFTQPGIFTLGASPRFGGTSAQCGSYSPPSATQRRINVFSSSVNGFLPALGGGITSSGSWDMIRSRIRLSSGLPGTTTRPLLRSIVTDPRSSKRSSAWREPGSCPWHLKQRSERIGRMSRP